MRRLVALLTIAAAAGALAMACGGGNEKPPMTPDSEHTTPEGLEGMAEGGAPESSTPAPKP